MSKKEDKIIKRIRKRLDEKSTIELWVKSGGRCQYVTCNKPLWKDSLTLRKMNKGYISHIIAASDNGPRGEKGKSEELELELSNLMLLCDECHNRIDKAQVSEHPKEVLLKMKQDHEKRIQMVTSIEPDKKSNVIIYTANIGAFEPSISFMDSAMAMREATYFPSSDLPIYLGLQKGVFTDDENEYWQIQEKQLSNSFRNKLKPLLELDKPHFSIFGLAPQPLLIKLGVQLSEITNCEVYQNHREPEQTWKWQVKQEEINVQLKEPNDKTKKAVLVISMSDMVNRDRIHAVLGNEVSIWEITVEKPNRNILKSKQTLENFKNRVRDAYSNIRKIQGEQSEIHLFPVMPNACAIETGRVWMPKVDLPLIIYDQNKNRDGFYKTITIKQYQMITTTQHLHLFLEQIAQALDITEAQYQQVVARYTAVSNHLAKEDSPLARFQPDILPQGSFLLGTMIRPIIESDELDVDLVCRLKGKVQDWAQKNVKEAVGDQIVTNEDYKRMLDDEGKRCWTLIYSGAFHLDILPALVGQEHYNLFEKSYAGLQKEQVDQLAIRITDNTLSNYPWDANPQNWPKSNPFGYAKWFLNRSASAEKQLRMLSESVEPLPEYSKEKEPLVRIVQILKRHRDIMFGNDDEKPISIIITTLAAEAYNKETDILQGLLMVLHNMEAYIKDKYSYEHQKVIKWINNPINSEENFADRWPKEPNKQTKFFDWLEKAKEDFGQIQHMNISDAYEYLKEILGTRSVNEGLKGLGLDTFISENKKPINYSSALLSVAHRQQPIWPMYNSFHCRIYAHYKNPKTNKRVTITGNTVVPKGCKIYFNAVTNVSRPFSVYWQVVNNGEEARNVNQLRGHIFPAITLGKGGLKHSEDTMYEGLHWIECFIVKDGLCVARSSEFFVNIKQKNDTQHRHNTDKSP